MTYHIVDEVGGKCCSATEFGMRDPDARVDHVGRDSLPTGGIKDVARTSGSCVTQPD